MSAPSFPPLFQGQAISGQIDPFEKAQAEALKGCDAGLVVYNITHDTLAAAIVFAPDVPLEDAMTMLPICAVAFQNALGALGPPEVAVHLDWDGGLRINGASCGALRIAASDAEPKTEPAWLIVGLTLPLWPASDDPGETPDETSLFAEGCADVDAMQLLESWVKHMLYGINRWTEDGPAPLHKEWRGLVHGLGEDISLNGKSGTFLGVDERFGMLLREDETTHLVPLTDLLERT